MADQKFTKVVQPGCFEYVVEAEVDETGSIQVEFDNEFMLDDLVIEVTLAGGVTISYDLNLKYPAGTVLEILATITGNFVLNNNASTRNMWFRVPAWTKLEMVINDITAGSTARVKFGVIGRG